MKNYLLGVMTVLIVALMSFNSIEDVFVVKPAKPKEVFCTIIYNGDLKETVYEYSKKGFIVKTIETKGDSYYYALVMEKY